MYDGDIQLMEELDEADYFHLGGSFTTNWMLSIPLGNDGYLCTFTVECQPNCN